MDIPIGVLGGGNYHVATHFRMDETLEVIDPLFLELNSK